MTFDISAAALSLVAQFDSGLHGRTIYQVTTEAAAANELPHIDALCAEIRRRLGELYPGSEVYVSANTAGQITIKKLS